MTEYYFASSKLLFPFYGKFCADEGFRVAERLCLPVGHEAWEAGSDT